MSKLVIAAIAGSLVGGACSAVGQVQIGAEMKTSRFVFAQVGGRDFFVGRLPRVGEAVEMVYIGKDAEGNMLLQLKVRPQ